MSNCGLIIILILYSVIRITGDMLLYDDERGNFKIMDT